MADALLQTLHVAAQCVYLLRERSGLLCVGQQRVFFSAVFCRCLRQVQYRIAQLLPFGLYGLHNTLGGNVAYDVAQVLGSIPAQVARQKKYLCQQCRITLTEGFDVRQLRICCVSPVTVLPVFGVSG